MLFDVPAVTENGEDGAGNLMVSGQLDSSCVEMLADTADLYVGPREQSSGEPNIAGASLIPDTQASDGAVAGCVDRRDIQDEECNGLDDDCDGLIDEGVGLNQCGGCIEAIREICNDSDTDCNGAKDDTKLDPPWRFQPDVGRRILEESHVVRQSSETGARLIAMTEIRENVTTIKIGKIGDAESFVSLVELQGEAPEAIPIGFFHEEGNTYQLLVSYVHWNVELLDGSDYSKIYRFTYTHDQEQPSIGAVHNLQLEAGVIVSARDTQTNLILVVGDNDAERSAWYVYDLAKSSVENLRRLARSARAQGEGDNGCHLISGEDEPDPVVLDGRFAQLNSAPRNAAVDMRAVGITSAVSRLGDDDVHRFVGIGGGGFSEASRGRQNTKPGRVFMYQIPTDLPCRLDPTTPDGYVIFENDTPIHELQIEANVGDERNGVFLVANGVPNADEVPQAGTRLNRVRFGFEANTTNLEAEFDSHLDDFDEFDTEHWALGRDGSGRVHMAWVQTEPITGYRALNTALFSRRPFRNIGAQLVGDSHDPRLYCLSVGVPGGQGAEDELSFIWSEQADVRGHPTLNVRTGVICESVE